VSNLVCCAVLHLESVQLLHQVHPRFEGKDACSQPKHDLSLNDSCYQDLRGLMPSQAASGLCASSGAVRLTPVQPSTELSAGTNAEMRTAARFVPLGIVAAVCYPRRSAASSLQVGVYVPAVVASVAWKLPGIADSESVLEAGLTLQRGANSSP